MSTKTARVQAYFAVAQMNYGEDISLAQVVAVHRGAFSAQITQGSDVKGDGGTKPWGSCRPRRRNHAAHQLH